jgi:hypothetical protein
LTNKYMHEPVIDDASTQCFVCHIYMSCRRWDIYMKKGTCTNLS